MTEDEKFMKAALAQAKKAAAIDEVPIGCVIVYDCLLYTSMASAHLKSHMSDFFTDFDCYMIHIGS